MIKLNRDEIIKELEGLVKLITCPEYVQKAFALIIELTEENERLHASCTDLTQNLRECKSDTVRKMQEALEQRIHSKLSYHGWYLKETVIAETAKEMLESE